MKVNKTLGLSIISVVLSIVLLAGTTFAWFTDTVENKDNVIQIGNLKVDLEKYEADAASDDEGEAVNDHYVSIAGDSGTLFDDTLWAPGTMQIVYLKAQNEGNLALDYSFSLNVNVPEGQTTNPADAFEYAIIDDAEYGDLDGKVWTDIETAVGADKVVALTTGITLLKEDIQLPAGESDYFALALYMKDVDNDYQNGELEIDVQLAAKQSVLENGAFGNGFDSDAEYGAEMLLPDVQPGPQEPQDLYKEDFENGIWEGWAEGTGAVATSDVNNTYVVLNDPGTCTYKALKSPIITNPGLEEGKTYKISFWIKNEKCAHEFDDGYAHPRVGVAFYNGNTAVGTVYEHGGYSNTESDATHCIKAGKGEWVQYEIEFIALDGDGIQIAVENRRYDTAKDPAKGSHGKILIDDITINPVE